MAKNYRWIVILLLILQICYPQMNYATDAVLPELFSFDEKSIDVLDSFYYSYYKASMWTGYYKLGAWFYSNQEVHINYSLKPSESIDISQGEGSTYFPFLNDFEGKVQDGNWDYYANLIENVNNWKYETYAESPGICDGGTFTEQISLYKSGSMVNSSIYIIDNNSCTGKRSIPQDSTVIDVMGNIHDYILELVESNQLAKNKTEICTPTFNGTYFISTIFILSIILIKRRTWKYR